MNKTITFIDLFAGIGGIRLGFEQACKELNISSKCVFTSEIKPSAIRVLTENFPNEKISNDITKINTNEIPNFDYLLAGFPCQAFSSAGKRLGFEDTRGTLFFEIARILSAKKPKGFLLENVEGLVTHNKENPKDKIGNTLSTILETLSNLGYNVSWRVLNAKDFGIPQNRKRIYIVGTLNSIVPLDNFVISHKTLDSVLEQGLPSSNHPFVKKLLQHYTLPELIGKSITDKRGGDNNIHSWNIELKGSVSKEQEDLLNRIMTERRKHKWADFYHIDWMDGMPLTLEMISSFYQTDTNLEFLLEDLVNKQYLVKEYPKKRLSNGKRIIDKTLPIGYNIVAGKLSFEVSKILNPKGIAPTIVATDARHLYIPDNNGIRPLSLREGLNLFGYPQDFKFNVNQQDGFDLLGNTVVVPIIREIAKRLL